MSRVLRVVGRPGVARGFSLAGVPALPALGAEDADEWLRRLRADPAVGVVLVQDVLFDALPAATQRWIARDPLPVVLPFPGPRVEAPPAEEGVLELLRRAIGYRVRLR